MAQSDHVILRYSLYLTILRAIIHCLMVITKPIFVILYERKTKLTKPSSPLLMKSATELAMLIRKQTVKSSAVVKAYIEQIGAVNPMLNAVVGERFDQALEEAAEVDKMLENGTVPEHLSAEKAPFLGVPFTVKEAFAVEGMIQSSGLLSRKSFLAPEDAVVVGLLKKAGAIPLCLTNTSELCMWYESSNLVHGRTNNAYHPGRIVGGSSGGEACIISAAGSVMGVGSDIGGSIRMPANFNGVFGHKPTTGVVSNEGQHPLAVNEASSFLSTGPLCRYAIDLLPMLQVMAGPDCTKLKLDHTVNTTAIISRLSRLYFTTWQGSTGTHGLENRICDKPRHFWVDVRRLKYYFMENDGGGYLPYPAHSEIEETVRKAAEHFKSIGATVTKVNVEQLKSSFEIWATKMMTSDNYSCCHLLGDQVRQVNPYVELALWLVRCPRHTLPAIVLGILEKIQSPAEVEAALVALCEQLRLVFGTLLGEDGIFLYPSHPVPAPYHHQPLFMWFNFAYTAVFNALGLPVSQVPISMATAERVPIGIQVAANYHNDHLCLAVARELEAAFGGWMPPF